MRNKSRKKRLGILIIVLLGALFFNFFVKKIDFFNIEKININGNKNVKKEDVIKDSDINLGENIFAISSIKSKKNLLKNPYIIDVKISRKLPNIVNINIKEEEEIFQIMWDRQYAVLDKDGNILNLVNNPTRDATIFKGLKLKRKLTPEDIGSNISSLTSHKRLEEFFNTASKIKLHKEIKEAAMVNNDILITLKNDKLVKFGGLKNSDYKLRLLLETIRHIDAEKIEFKEIIMDRGKNPIIVLGKDTAEKED